MLSMSVVSRVRILQQILVHFSKCLFLNKLLGEARVR